MTFGERLLVLRKHLNLTQADFAKPLGTTRGYIATLETSDKEPSESLLKLISYEYGISYAWLKNGEGEMFLTPEESLKSLISRHGEQALMEAANKVFVEHTLAVTVERQMNRHTYTDPELNRLINFLEDFWASADDRTKIWAAVQIERAFPEIKEFKMEKERRYSNNEGKAAKVIEENSVYLPVLGVAAAGRPIEAIEMLDGYLPIPAELARGKCFMIRVKGDSMTGDGISDGDLAVIRANTDVETGEIGLFKVNEEVALKRKKIKKGKLYLTSSNKKYPPIPVKNISELITIGKYITHIPKARAEQQIKDMPGNY